MRALRPAAPLLTVVGLTAALVVFTAVAGFIVRSAAGFLAERDLVVAIWLAGLAIVALITGLTLRASLRRASTPGSVFLLGLTAIVLASPLLLVLLQHPSR
jgi:hypothetical protein